MRRYRRSMISRCFRERLKYGIMLGERGCRGVDVEDPERRIINVKFGKKVSPVKQVKDDSVLALKVISFMSFITDRQADKIRSLRMR